MTNPTSLSRRRFLTRATLTVGAGLVLPSIIPAGVLAAPGRPGANDRIRTGHIGVGGMGGYHLNYIKSHPELATCVAIADADQGHLKHAGEVIGGNVKLFPDFRELLALPEVDACIIATPDHWHGVMTVMACEAGKDVYCEKPACCTIAEGRAMVNTAARYGRIIQIGSQGRSQPAAWAAGNYLRNGKIGRVPKVTCWHYQNPTGADGPDADPPAELNYDMWLGPLRWRPYNKDTTHGNFRWLLESGGGQIRDRGAHVMSVVLFVMNADHYGPVSIEASGLPPQHGRYEAPPDMEVVYTFKDPDWELHWSQPGQLPEEAADLGNNKYGSKYWGETGTLVVSGGDGGTDTEKKAKEYHAPINGPKVYRSPEHHEDFFNCLRTREQPIMNIRAAHAVASLCVLGNLSWRLQRKLQWDWRTEKFIGDEQANLLLNRPARSIWHL
jgi:predicted dehydrogenase